MRAILLSLGLLLLPLASAIAGPQPPCAGASAPVPAYGALDGSPTGGAWHDSDLKGWQPPACLGWQGESRLVAAIASRFRSPLTLDQLAGRLTAVTASKDIKYWSVSGQKWKPFVLGAWLVEGPDGKVRRPDPPFAGFVPGRDFFYAEDAGGGSLMVYRVRVLERTADRVVLAMENVSPIKALLLTLFEPGALQYVSYLVREGPDSWAHYEIGRATTGASSFVTGYQSSFLNRLEAVRRHLAGVPTDRDPPLAPR